MGIPKPQTSRERGRPFPLIFPLNIPSPPQGVWHLGPFPVRAYALCILAGIGVAVWIGERRWMARGGSPAL